MTPWPRPLTPLEEALESWGVIRYGLVFELQNVPGDRLDFRPSPASRTVAEIVRHVLEAGLTMTGELSRPDTDFRREPWPQMLARYGAPVRDAGSKEQLLEALSSTFGEARVYLRALGEAGIQQVVTRPDGKPGTKLACLHQALAHEAHHRGQLTVYERLMGLEPTSSLEGRLLL